MKVLVLNAGSSSLKFDLFEISPETIATDSELVLAHGQVERVSSMAEALRVDFRRRSTACKVEAVGHRVVHGGDRFHESMLIDAEVEKAIDELSVLAPLHNPHNLEAYRAAQRTSAGCRRRWPFSIRRFITRCRRARMCTGCRTNI